MTFILDGDSLFILYKTKPLNSSIDYYKMIDSIFELLF